MAEEKQFGNTKCTDDEIAMFVRRYAAGEPLHTIAADAGRSYSVVRSHIEASGAEIRPPGPPKGTTLPAGEKRAQRDKCTAEEIATFVRRYADGESLYKIAADTGRAYSAVHNHVKASGMKMRPPGTPKRPRSDTQPAVDATPEEIAYAKQRYGELATIRTIAGEMHRSKVAVTRMLDAAGVQRRPRGALTFQPSGELMPYPPVACRVLLQMFEHQPHNPTTDEIAGWTGDSLHMVRDSLRNLREDELVMPARKVRTYRLTDAGVAMAQRLQQIGTGERPR
jgi:hypothetical protein